LIEKKKRETTTMNIGGENKEIHQSWGMLMKIKAKV
jgi:hypothetical protein